VVKWLVLAVVLLGLVILVLAMRPVVSRLGTLRRAAMRLLERQRQAEALQATSLALQHELETLRLKTEITQERLALIKVRRGR
jgi:HAMP domain-containing protein